MNRFLKIMSVFFLVLALALTLILGLRNISDGSELGKMEAELQTTLKGSGVDGGKLLDSVKAGIGAPTLTAGQFTRGGVSVLLLAVLILFFTYLTLVSKRKLLAKTAWILLALAVLSIVLNPHFSSAFGPASSRVLATVGAGLALVGVGLSLLWAKRTQTA